MSHLESSPYTDIIQQGKDAWGEECARDIFGGLITAVYDANVKIQPPHPVDCFRIQIAAIPEVERGIQIPRILGLHDKATGFSLVLDDSSPNEVQEQMRATVFHETARVHIWQHRIKNGVYKNNDENTVLDTCIEDGMTIAAVEQALPRQEQYDNENYTSYGLSEGFIAAKIAEFSELGYRSEDVEWALRKGTAELPRLSYRIGHAIVKSAIDYYDLGIVQQLRQPPEFYVKWARYRFGV